MTTILKFTAFARSVLGASLLGALPVTAYASGGDDDIVVHSASAMEQWQKQTALRLDRALQRDVGGRTDTGDSIVQIAFTLGPDGKAQGLRFHNGEGTWIEREMAKRAVRSLDNLDEVPVVNRGDVKFLANFIFSTDPRSHAKLAQRLRTMEQARLASRDGTSRYLALGY
jgi:hypothetical protein